MQDVINRFQQEQRQAVENQDANANLCVLATVDHSNRPRLRTLILRASNVDGFSVFTTASSRKWQHLQQNPNSELLIYWPSLKIQYRISGRAIMGSQDLIAQGWPNRPLNNKVLDHFYSHNNCQGHGAGERGEILRQLEDYKKSLDQRALATCPPGNLTLVVQFSEIEKLQLMENGIHHRQVFYKENQVVVAKTLWP